eukprot:scaffold96651_cov65-Phaeocystis_antarctica.AAC.8
MGVRGEGGSGGTGLEVLSCTALVDDAILDDDVGDGAGGHAAGDDGRVPAELAHVEKVVERDQDEAEVHRDRVEGAHARLPPIVNVAQRQADVDDEEDPVDRHEARRLGGLEEAAAGVGGGGLRLRLLVPPLDGLEVEEQDEGDPHEHRTHQQQRELEAEELGHARRLELAALRAVDVLRRGAAEELHEAERAADKAAGNELQALGLDDEVDELELVHLLLAHPVEDDHDAVDAEEGEEEGHEDGGVERVADPAEQREVARLHGMQQRRAAPLDWLGGSLRLVAAEGLTVLLELEAGLEDERVEQRLLHLLPEGAEDVVEEPREDRGLPSGVDRLLDLEAELVEHQADLTDHRAVGLLGHLRLDHLDRLASTCHARNHPKLLKHDLELVGRLAAQSHGPPAHRSRALQAAQRLEAGRRGGHLGVPRLRHWNKRRD